MAEIRSMPGAGTDKTRRWVETPAPCVILVETQLADNIGSVARAMANFGLSELRLVNPKQGWPHERAVVMAAGADRVLNAAKVYDTVEAAIGDLHYVFATTARAHDQAKPVVAADTAATVAGEKIAAGERVGLMFGRERNGLENQEVGLADSIITLPVNPAFASLNLGQAVVIVAYEWFKHATSGALPFGTPQRSDAAPREQLLAFFQNLEHELEKVEFFRPPDKRDTMQINLRNIFSRMQPTQQDIHTLHGVIMTIAQGRKGPARGGVLDTHEAAALRSVLTGQGAPGDGGPVRGLARLLRRNPTDAERALWEGITKDRRFAGLGFKRQTPVGTHVTDMVSFPLRLVIDIVPPQEAEDAAKARAYKRQWLGERGYRVLGLRAEDLERDVTAALDEIAKAASRSQ
jgi:tRNA/rRNA methyltransferase